VIVVPADAMVVLVGIAGSGKSTFAQAHFAPTEVLSSDAFRAVVADDEADQSASEDAFALLHAALEARLKRGRLAVVDATNVEEWGRRQLLDIAKATCVGHRARRVGRGLPGTSRSARTPTGSTARGSASAPGAATIIARPGRRRICRGLRHRVCGRSQCGEYRTGAACAGRGQRNVPKEPRPTRRCEIIESTPERLMQSRDPAALPLRDDRRISNPGAAAQGRLSPTFRA
jgi:predicted kinase